MMDALVFAPIVIALGAYLLWLTTTYEEPTDTRHSIRRTLKFVLVLIGVYLLSDVLSYFSDGKASEWKFWLPFACAIGAFAIVIDQIALRRARNRGL